MRNASVASTLPMNQLMNVPTNPLMNPLMILGMIWVMSLAGLGCGDPARAPFTLQINSADVVQTAVDQIEIVLRPSVAGQRFAPQADTTHFGGTVTTRVTGAGEFAMFVERAYLDTYAVPGDLMSAFIVGVPLLMTTDAGQEVPEDPTVDVTFIRGGERIADARRFVVWPLPDGGEVSVRVLCDRDGGFARQCLNNNPIADSGTLPTDGGM